MSNPDTGPTGRGVKTLAIRLEPDMHAQLTLIAQLRSSTVTDEFRKALEAHIERAKDAPELAAQADTALEDIERDALARRAAITSLFGSDAVAEPAAEPADEPNVDTNESTPTRTRARKGSGDKNAT